jgi:hypothetical protein
MEIEDQEAVEAGSTDPEEAEPEEGQEASLEELLAKKSRRQEESEEPAEEEAMLNPEAEDRVATSLPGKVTPKQETEFVCKSCFLVKHQSQLADPKRMLCKDCA